MRPRLTRKSKVASAALWSSPSTNTTSHCCIGNSYIRSYTIALELGDVRSDPPRSHSLTARRVTPSPDTPSARFVRVQKYFRTRGLKPQQPPALMLGSFLCSFQFDKAGHL